MTVRTPLEVVVSLAMRGVNEVKNATIPADVKIDLRGFETCGAGEGNTVANRKKKREIIEDDANVRRPHRSPQSLSAYMPASPTLTVQLDTATQNKPKYRLVESLGFLAQTPIPRDRFASAGNRKRKMFRLIARVC
jgi:hypothetical protein